MTSRQTACSVGAFLLISVTAANAQWQAIGGPLSISGLTVAADDTLYAGSAVSGVSRYNVATMEWDNRSAGLTDTNVLALAADPMAAGTLYAGTGGSVDQTGGVFKTADGGNSWVSISSGLSGQGFNVLGIDPANQSTLYAGGSGIFKSTDGGVHWIAASTGLTDAADGVFGLAIDPVNTATIYTSTGDGPFKSTNGGSTWLPISNFTDLPAGYRPYSANQFAIDPAATSTVYLASFVPVSVPVGNGVYKTTDGGSSWNPLGNGGPSGVVTSVALDARNPTIVYAAAAGSVFRSADSGGHWTALNGGLPTGWSFGTLAVSTDGTIYLGTDTSGVFRISSPSDELLAGVIPAAIAGPGAAGAFFRTSLQLRNPADPETQPQAQAIEGHLVFHPSGLPGSINDPSLTFSLQPGQMLSISDLVGQIGQSGLGSIDVLTTDGTMPVGLARVFNDAGAAGTYGFSESVSPLSDALNAGDRGILFAPPDLVAFRWNIGIRSLGGGATISMAVHDAQGNLTRTVTRAFGPNLMVQEPAADFIVDDASPGALATLNPNDSLTITVTSGNALVYGAVVDNHSNDPSFQLARKVQ